MQPLLPVITTRRPDRRDRGYLAWVAVANEVATLPLETPPIDASPHVLEIYVEGFDEPLVVLAEPAGAPDGANSFPLRLAPLDELHAEQLRQELFGAPQPPKSNEPTLDDTPSPDSARRRPSLAPLTPGMSPNAKRTSSIPPPPPITSGHAAALARVTGGGGPSTAARRAPGALKGRALADGRFVLESLLGGGASGEVYRAMHTMLRRPVAVKVLHPTLQLSQDYCARFYAEALAASQLDHRNVLRILDYGQEPDGLLYIVMELLDGKNLERILEETGPLPLERLVDIAIQACAGIGHAHDAGVVHRDIKPENLVVVKRKNDEGTEGELVKVCDFGIAHWVPEVQKEITDDDATLVKLPDSKKVVGTPAYMAPEQIRNEPVDARTDVYAFGVVLYELATGRLPFLSARPLEILMLHVTERPEPPSKLVLGLDPRLEEIILKALEKNPDRRHPNMRVLRTALRELVDDDWATGSGQFRRVSVARQLPTASDFVTDTANALAAVATADDKSFGAAMHALGEGLREAVNTGNVRTARDLLAWLEQRTSDPGLTGEHREHIDRVLRVIRDPAPVRALAGQLLSGKLEKPEDAAPILAIAGPVGARSLLEARRVQTPTLETRARFVQFLRATGPSALPVILGGLEPLVPLASRSDEALADDLLRAAPDVRSDAAGELTVRFVRPDKPALAVVALRATVTFWGPRAQGLLLGILDSNIDDVRLAAVEALQKLRTIDDWAIERLGRVIVAQPPAAIELRVAAATALALATGDGRQRVVAFLHERLSTAPQGLVSSLMKAFGPREDARLVVALARSLAALDPGGASHALRAVVAARPELRLEIEAVIAGR
ncbi:MAG: serine/threonine protein kinase [Deltaproteobacteria bacterium]|nr:serine/threonine protein kinase [Deltaproteobacteria bacterium]